MSRRMVSESSEPLEGSEKKTFSFLKNQEKSFSFLDERNLLVTDKRGS
ncbi:MAG: hypothetical protein HYV97_01030 [Bdellovibrio sp.]|nr:hypothetical protein [Bdellovibrio sp.]